MKGRGVSFPYPSPGAGSEGQDVQEVRKGGQGGKILSPFFHNLLLFLSFPSPPTPPVLLVILACQ